MRGERSQIKRLRFLRVMELLLLIFSYYLMNTALNKFAFVPPLLCVLIEGAFPATYSFGFGHKAGVMKEALFFKKHQVVLENIVFFLVVVLCTLFIESFT